MKIRTYRCNDCRTYFKTIKEPYEASCPKCAKVGVPPAAPKRSDIPSPAVLSDATKIKNEVSQQLMDDFGMTNMRDNQRAGDIAAPPLDANQRRLMEQAKGFWNPSTGMAGLAQVGNNSGIPRDHAMKTVQNLAKRIEGLK